VDDGKATLALINAFLNGTSATLLVSAYVLIKRRRIIPHVYLMLSAVITSAVFLVFYLTSYYKYGDRTSGLEAGWLRTVYFVILVPHVILAMVMLPMIGMTIWRAYRRQWDRHRRMARPTFWIWLYVSVTGVAIYLMLYHLFPAVASRG
jgi:uncharacterized membrane protein YozB (DUF420 family)